MEIQSQGLANQTTRRLQVNDVLVQRKGALPIIKYFRVTEAIGKWVALRSVSIISKIEDDWMYCSPDITRLTGPSFACRAFDGFVIMPGGDKASLKLPQRTRFKTMLYQPDIVYRP